MKWIVCKAAHEFNKEQDCSMYRATECLQIFDTEEEAIEAQDLFYSVNSNGEFTYIVINSDQIGELVR